MKKAILALILAVTMFATSCSTSWLTTFDNYVAIAAPAVVQIITAVDVAEGIPVDQAVLAKVTQDAAALRALGQSIVTATGTNIPTACAAFNEGVATFAADIPTLEQLGGIKDPTRLAEISAGIALAQGLILSIEQPIAACQAAPTPAAARLALVKGAVKVQSPSDFATQFNKHNLGKKLHVNPWYVRAVTLGAKK